jgi:tRNA nucleotidyltransferase (CCA-adding enzyme)
MPYVEHAQIAAFAEKAVNLHREDVEQFRQQVNRLRDRLATYIAGHPDYSLIKMLHSGSVAKGTALRTINDMDVAVYVLAADAPVDETRLLYWLRDRLQEVYGGVMSPEQFQVGTHCVRISFRGTGLDVDVVPVLYEGDADDKGYLVTRDTGQRVLTSIPLHLEFIRERKRRRERHFAQVIRLLKWWVREEKQRNGGFRFKSFLVELLCAHQADKGLELSDYTRALEAILAYIVKSRLQERISFTDHYEPVALPPPTGAPIEVFDPVNPENNVASNYSGFDRDVIVEAADRCLSAIAEARFATTKQRAVQCWRVVLGPAFQG